MYPDLIANFLSLTREFSVKFEFYPLVYIHNDWYNIIHFTINQNDNEVGDRIPAVWTHFNKGTSTRRALHICSGIDNNKNHCVDSPYVEVKKWHRIEISQRYEGHERKTVYTVSVDGRLIEALINNKPREFQNVKVYASDPWHREQNGYIRNFEASNEIG